MQPSPIAGNNGSVFSECSCFHNCIPLSMKYTIIQNSSYIWIIMIKFAENLVPTPTPESMRYYYNSAGHHKKSVIGVKNLYW